MKKLLKVSLFMHHNTPRSCHDKLFELSPSMYYNTLRSCWKHISKLSTPTIRSFFYLNYRHLYIKTPEKSSYVVLFFYLNYHYLLKKKEREQRLVDTRETRKKVIVQNVFFAGISLSKMTFLPLQQSCAARKVWEWEREKSQS